MWWWESDEVGLAGLLGGTGWTERERERKRESVAARGGSLCQSVLALAF